MAAARMSFSKLCRRCRFHGALASSSPQPLKWNVSYRSISTSPPVRQLSEPTGPTVPEEAAVSGQVWRIVAAVCVQRMPTLGREKTDLELRYLQMKDQCRVEKSKLSDHELEEIAFEKLKRARVLKAQEEDISEPTNAGGDEESNAFEDLQESREIELQEFEPASRETEADREGDMRSLERKLDRVLYLLVKKPRNEHAWQMPQGGVEGDESLIEAGQREFTEECGADTKVKFYSSSPLAVLSYNHLHSPHNGPSSHFAGSKVFFLKAIYQSGVLQLDNDELVDHMWVTKEEMGEYVSQDYYRAVKPILLE